MPTEKLFYQDPYLKEFTARILQKHQLADGHWKVLLDRTAFYPEGGGQPCDHGSLGLAKVIDVRTENGDIIHTTDSDPGTDEVQGRLDWNRRFDHMQQHTGEHILSGIFLSKFDAQNVGFHLSPNSCQIDVTLSSLDVRQVQDIENDANRVVFKNLPITSRFYSEDEMSGLFLRKEPGKEFDEVRLVAIENCDCCPCGGTHVSHTGEAGLIKIRSWEKRKTNLRIDFVTGFRALADYRLKHDIVRNLSAKLSTPPEGILSAHEKQCERFDTQTRQLSTLRKEYHAILASQLLAAAESSSINGTRIVTHVFTDYTASDLSDFAGRIVSHNDTIVLLAGVSPENNRSIFLFSAAASATIPMQELLRETLLPFGGKCGGNAIQAQGGAPTANAEELLASARNLFKYRLRS